MTNTCYDKECNIAIKSIMGSFNESLKLNKKNMYKSLIKMKKWYYINRKKEDPLHLYKIDPKKLWRQVITRKTKEKNMIPLMH